MANRVAAGVHARQSGEIVGTIDVGILILSVK